MKTLKYSLLAFALIFVLGISVPTTAEEEYVIAVPMVEGLEATNIGSYLENMADVLTNKLGVKITSHELVYKYGERIIDKVLEEFDAKNAHVSYVFGIEYARYRRSGGKKLIPLFTLSMNQKTMMDQCFYVRKGEYETVEDLRDARWAGAQLLPSRLLLFEAGIDEPVNNFFGSIQYLTDSPLKVMIDAMEKDEIDVFTTFRIIMKLSGQMNQKQPAVEIEPLFCRDYDYTWVFVGRSDLPDKIVEQTRKVLFKAHKDPDFAAFKFAFQMLDGHFVPITEDSLEDIYRIIDMAEEGGWFEEQEEFSEEHSLTE